MYAPNSMSHTLFHRGKVALDVKIYQNKFDNTTLKVSAILLGSCAKKAKIPSSPSFEFYSFGYGGI